ncbi:hypothetical protein WS9_007565 [Paraclostridium sordellii 8483]|nr:hypothetical protein WS9_007565 [Paeniclostridium sordellii 8483]
MLESELKISPLMIVRVLKQQTTRELRRFTVKNTYNLDYISTLGNIFIILLFLLALISNITNSYDSLFKVVYNILMAIADLYIIYINAKKLFKNFYNK